MQQVIVILKNFKISEISETVLKSSFPVASWFASCCQVTSNGT